MPVKTSEIDVQSHTSNWQVAVQSTDLLTWVFGTEGLHDPHRPLFIDANDPKRSMTYVQARTAVRTIINGLRALGIKPGDSVALHTYNIYYPILFLAVIGAGGVFVGSNPGYKEYELTNLIEKSRASLIITAPDLLPTVLNVTQELNVPDRNIMVFAEEHETPAGFLSWEKLFHYGEGDWVRFDTEEQAKETPACLVTTSGTTGLPKMAMLSHQAWVASNCCVEDPTPKPYQVRRLIFLPLFHTFAAPLAHLAPLRSGHAAYIMPRYSRSGMIAAIQRFKINELLLVPPMITGFITTTTPQDFLKNIRFVFCGGAPLDGETVKKMYHLLAPDACIAQVYGMTEAGWITTLKFPERDESGSVGKLLPNVEAKLVNPVGEVIREPGHRGEILVRGPRLMSGYFNNPKATAEAFTDGWLRTGDVGIIDKGGRVFVVDRQKDLIKVRGWQVSPAELEGVLRTHPKVLDVAVIGVPYNNSEAPKALVVRADETLSEEHVKAYVASLLIGYKHLDGGVRFVDSIPKSVSGKILRKLLPVS